MKLSKKSIGVCIWSEDYEKLAKWYEEILNFKVKSRLNLPNDTVVDFDFGENFFSVGRHSEVKGQNSNPQRIMINFNVDDVHQTYEELKDKGVKFVAEPFEVPKGGYYCMTIQDPDGNILQFFGPK